jgi:cyclic-di-GMP-binding biofilm dispersal mediator protein
MSELKSRSILILGASGVIGQQLVQQLSAQGAIVLGTATNLEAAARIPNQASVRLLLDLMNPESIDVLVEYLVQADIAVDGVINATGVVAFGSVAELEPATVDHLFNVDVVGPIKVLSGLIPVLKNSAAAGHEPFICTISGVVAEQPMAGMAAYSAAKAALNSFTKAAGRELRRDGIRVFDARPGHTETGLADRAIAGTAPAFATGMAAESVAARILKAIIEDEKDLPSSEFA